MEARKKTLNEENPHQQEFANLDRDSDNVLKMAEKAMRNLDAAIQNEPDAATKQTLTDQKEQLKQAKESVSESTNKFRSDTETLVGLETLQTLVSEKQSKVFILSSQQRASAKELKEGVKSAATSFQDDKQQVISDLEKLQQTIKDTNKSVRQAARRDDNLDKSAAKSHGNELEARSKGSSHETTPSLSTTHNLKEPTATANSLTQALDSHQSSAPSLKQ